MAKERQNTPDLLTLYIAIGALIVAALALAVSIKSWCVSGDVLKTMDDFRLEQNRPELLLTARKFNDTESFLKTSHKENTFVVEFRFEVKNEGRGQANNIALPDIAGAPAELVTQDINLSYEHPSKLSLRSGESFYFYPRLTFKVEPHLAESTLEKLNGNQWETYIRLKFSYLHNQDPKKKYEIIMEWDISKTWATPRRSAFKKPRKSLQKRRR